MLKSLLLKSLFELSYFTRKTSVKINFFQKSKGPLLLTEWLYEYHFWSVLHISVFSKKYMFSTLVNIRQKL